MKSILLIILLTISSLSFGVEGMVWQCARCKVTDLPANLQVGLIGYYPFCGNAKDESGNGNDAKVYGATLTSDRFGNPSSAYYFNGTSDYMAAGPINQYINNFNITIAAWVKHTGYNTNLNCSNGCAQYVVSIGSDQKNGSVGFGVQQDLQNPWFVMIDAFSNNGWMFGNAGYPIPNQDWHLIVITYDKPRLNLYVDCVLDTSINYKSSYNFINDSVRIGKHNISGYPYFTHGNIDDIMIYNRVLSATEISQLCNPGQVAFISSDSTFCSEGGGCINFFDRSSICNATSWKWHFPGAVPDTSSLQNPANICYYIPGTYPVTLVVGGSNGSDSLTVSPMITFANSASAPVLTSSGDTIFCSPASSYQWYFNGSPIPNATNSFYEAKADGVYAVQITDGNGCSRLSSGFPVAVNELTDPTSINIFTNPVNGQVNISLKKNINHGEVNVFNLIGEKIYSGQFTGSKMTIDSPGLKISGIYIIRIKDAEKQFFGKVIVP